MLISTRFGDTNQLHVVAAPMGARTQLTFGREPIVQARFLPGDPNVLYYLQDVGGGEFFQVYRLERRSGRTSCSPTARAATRRWCSPMTAGARVRRHRAQRQGHGRLRGVHATPPAGPRAG